VKETVGVDGWRIWAEELVVEMYEQIPRLPPGGRAERPEDFLGQAVKQTGGFSWVRHSAGSIHVILKDNIIIKYNVLANRANIQKRRFHILDTLLKWEGELSNGRIRELIDIQVVSASRLLADYREAYPDRLSWDSSKKRYLLRPTRERFGGSADDYLRLLVEESGEPEWIEQLDTSISVVHQLVLSAIRQAIETGIPVRIDYASMTHPEGQTRDIFPFHVVQAGRRWHVRAWCCMRKEYRDFVLGRIRSVEDSSNVIRPDMPDTGWETRVDVRLVPHSALSLTQAQVIRDELFDGTTARRVRTRACLVPYVVQDVRASVSADQMPPDYQIEVANLAEIHGFLFP